MMVRSSLIVSLVLVSGVFAGELAEKFAKRLESADAAYQAAVQKADNVRFYAVQKATQERNKVLKLALTDATKAGDFDAATEIKARMAASEAIGSRPKPKNLLKFGGHEYAVIEDKASWHVAKRICEEMGGHLAILDSAAETAYLRDICRTFGAATWYGAFNEEGTWLWANGTKVASTEGWITNDSRGQAGGMTFWQPGSVLDDYGIGAKMAFVCEWE